MAGWRTVSASPHDPLRTYPGELRALLLALSLAVVLILFVLGAIAMRKLKLVAIAAGALALSACATTSFTEYAKAANELDPGCKKEVEITAQPVLIFGFPVPVVSGVYKKTCEPRAEAPPT